jgi:hypothetical protein
MLKVNIERRLRRYVLKDGLVLFSFAINCICIESRRVRDATTEVGMARIVDAAWRGAAVVAQVQEFGMVHYRDHLFGGVYGMFRHRWFSGVLTMA